jgi:hypothetical protein
MERTELTRAAAVSAAVPGITVPPLYAADEDDQTLVIGYIDNPQSLLNYAWNEPGRARALRAKRVPPETIGARLGAWLAAYAKSSERSGEDAIAPSREALIRATRSRLETLQRRDRRFLRPETFARVFSDIEALADRLRNDPMLSAATAHGDLNLSNVLIDPDGALYVIDFADARPALAAEDVVNVWHTLEMICLLSRRHEWFLLECLRALAAGAGLEPGQFLERDDVKLLRINQALVQVLAAQGIGWMDRRLGRRTHWRLAHLNRQWLESGCPCVFSLTVRSPRP